MEAYLHHSDLNMICVCPGMQNFWYTDMVNGWAYFTYMTVELPNFIETVFRASGKREDRFIAGLSMGGYGALQIAMKNPDRYAAVASFSGGLDVAHMSVGQEADAITLMEMKAVFGTENPKDLEGTEFDLYHVVDSAVKAANSFRKCMFPAVRMTACTAYIRISANSSKTKRWTLPSLSRRAWPTSGILGQRRQKLIDWLPVRKELRRA